MIGYYIHHHGVGHLTRAMSIARRLDEPVVALSSRAEPAEHPFAQWISLPLDVGDQPAVDATAGGVLHWAPVDTAGLRDRAAALTAWIADCAPRLVVVDVSVEVTALVRLTGTPVAVMAMPGERTDAPHLLAYQLADRIIAPWSQQLYDPSWLHPFVDVVTYVGSISRFEQRELPAPIASTRTTVLVLGGAGGSSIDRAAVERSAAAAPEFDWVTAGIGSEWIDDVWPLLNRADIVITHAGQNAIADVATARSAAVVIAQDRPFDEQFATAKALADNGVAVVLPDWPQPEQWNSILADASALDTDRWALAHTDGAAERAADVVRR